MTTTVSCPPLTTDAQQRWESLFRLAEALPMGWTVIGGQMAHLHAWERGISAPRPTTDIDTGLDFRAVPEIGITATRVLADLGFVPATTSTDGPAVRWVQGVTQIDVLIPTGSRTPRRDINGSRLLEGAGIQQALDRSAVVRLVTAESSGLVRRPSLFGSIVAKAASLSNAGDAGRARHLADLAFLLSLLIDADMSQETVTSRDLHHLAQGITALNRDPAILEHPAAARGAGIIRSHS